MDQDHLHVPDGALVGTAANVSHTEPSSDQLTQTPSDQHQRLCASPWSSDWEHSRYVRHLADEAVGGRPVVVDLSVRRLYCENPQCPKQTFVEQVEGLTAHYQRRTPALARVVNISAGHVGGLMAYAVAGSALGPAGFVAGLAIGVGVSWVASSGGNSFVNGLIRKYLPW